MAAAQVKRSTSNNPPVETPTSTRLIDNPAPANASFDSYAQVSVYAIPGASSTAVFIGTNRYIKIALTSGDVLLPRHRSRRP